jgi:mono/diheme cytochrome c family protein
MVEDGVPAGERASVPRSRAGLRLAIAALVASFIARGAAAQDFSPERIAIGARIFARNCSPCHGPHMRDPESAFDLRKFPHDAHDRFVASVTHGKNQMPPWGDLIKPDEIEALWAYVVAGER